MKPVKKKTVILVAHPDDEILWSGGTILNHAQWKCFIISLCRGSDPDRSSKFKSVLKKLKAEGVMADLDDGPEQIPLDQNVLDQTILHLLPSTMDLLITHSPKGEYTRHRRHEEIGHSIISLWLEKKIHPAELWIFAYDDDHGTQLPSPDLEADYYFPLTDKIFELKYKLITEEYGFSPDSWEARTCPKIEAFRRFSNPKEADSWKKPTRIPAFRLK